MKVNDDVLRKLTEYLIHIDYTQPKAHEVCREITETIGRSIITDLDNTTDRESRFFSLGVAYQYVIGEYQTIPPVKLSINQRNTLENKTK